MRWHKAIPQWREVRKDTLLSIWSVTLLWKSGTSKIDATFPGGCEIELSDKKSRLCLIVICCHGLQNRVRQKAFQRHCSCLIASKTARREGVTLEDR